VTADTRLTAPQQPDFIPATHHHDQSERCWSVVQILQETNVLKSDMEHEEERGGGGKEEAKD